MGIIRQLNRETILEPTEARATRYLTLEPKKIDIRFHAG